MIIYKNPISIITRNDIPNGNWTDNNDVFVVDDNSDLGKKILANFPYFNFVLDDQGNLVDITPDNNKKTEQELLGKLIPSEDDVKKAEAEVQILTLLMEVGLV